MSKYFHIDESFFLPDREFFVQTLSYIETLYHEHTFFEIFYVLTGEITHIVNDKEEILRSGDIVFLRPGDRHMFSHNNSSNFLHTDILVKNRLFRHVVDTLDHPLLRNFMMANEPCKLHLSPQEIARIEEEIRYIENADIKDTPPPIFALLCNLLCLIIRKNKPSEPTQRPLWLRQLLSMLHVNNTFQKTREEVYELLHSLSYNRSYISRAFKKYMGCTLTQFINDLRFSVAYSLLRSTDDSISDIIEQIGLSNKSYFYREFYKRYHATPAQIRNRPDPEDPNDNTL